MPLARATSISTAAASRFFATDTVALARATSGSTPIFRARLAASSGALSCSADHPASSPPAFATLSSDCDDLLGPAHIRLFAGAGTFASASCPFQLCRHFACRFSSLWPGGGAASVALDWPPLSAVPSGCRLGRGPCFLAALRDAFRCRWRLFDGRGLLSRRRFFHGRCFLAAALGGGSGLPFR